MTLLPIVDRELRIVARKSQMYWQRLTIAAVAAILCGWILETMPILGTARQAGSLFFILANLCFFYGSFSGLALSADCISRENREGTLGLLFLTPLQGYDVIFGKLAAGSLVSFYHLLAVFPVLAISLLIGGVTITDFFHSTLAILNTMFFCQSMAILISTQNREAQKSYSKTIALLVLFLIVFPALEKIPTTIIGGEFLHTLSLASPSLAFSRAKSSGLAANSYWISLLVSHLVAWTALGWAILLVPNCWREKNLGSWRSRWQETRNHWTYGDFKARTRWRTKLLEINPYLWVINRKRFQRLLLWTALIVLLSGMIGLFLLAHYGHLIPLQDGELIFGAAVLHTVLKIVVASSVANQFDRQKRNGELELLLSGTPISLDDIFGAVWLDFRRTFLLPAVSILALDVLAITIGCWQANTAFTTTKPFWYFPLVMLGMMVMFAIDLWAMTWTAMWNGISTAKPTQGGGVAIQRILFLPWGIFALTSSITDILAAIWGFKRPGFFYYFVIWLVLGIVNDLFWVKWSRRKLYAEFRDLVMRYSDEKLTFWGKMGRVLGKLWRNKM